MDGNELNIVFIGGTGRSGTNITKKVLSLHPNVATLPFEYRFSIDPFCIIDTYLSLKHNWSPYNAHAKIKKMEAVLNSMGNRSMVNYLSGRMINLFDPSGKKMTPPPYYEWEMEKWFPGYFDHVCRLINDLTDFEYNASWPGEEGYIRKNSMRFVSYGQDYSSPFRNFFRAVFNGFLQTNQSTHFVEDNTWSLLYANELLEILPDARFIHVVRDPRDVLASLMNQRWAPNELKDVTVYYSSIMNKILEIEKELGSENYFVLKLEDLVSDKKNMIGAICDFSNLKIEEAMLNIDLAKHHSGRFRNDFTKKDQKFVTQSLAPYLEKFNYTDT